MTQPLRIGVVRQRFVARGGAERYLQAVIGELARRGHQVHLFANSWVGEDSDAFLFHRVPMIRVSSFGRVLSFALWCRRATQRVPCDVIFSLERTLRQDVYRAGDGVHAEWLVQRRKYLPSAWTAVNPLHSTILRIEQRIFSPSVTDLVIANSYRGKEEIIRHFDYPDERISVIHNGVDLERFRFTPRISGKDLKLLFVGTGWERKGLPFCIAALAKLPGARLRVVGKGDAAKYSRLAASLKVANRVEFAGVGLDITEEYGRADLLVHPAIYEPFANVCLEALACGLPVITTRINGASEIIENGVNGAVIGHPDGLADAVRIFDKPSVRQTAAIAARKTAERLPLSLNVSRTLEVLLVASQKRKPLP